MYRLVLCLAVFNFVEPHQWCNKHTTLCHRHHHDYKRRHEPRDDRFFQRLANDLIEVDSKAKMFCAQNQGITAKEIYEQDVYKYIVSLPSYNESKIEVKIKHRVLYIKAEKDENTKYVNVKILTDLLNTASAKWYYGNGELTIAVPYKVAVAKELPTNCGDEINSNIIEVPKADYEPDENPDIDVRFSQKAEHVNITENIV
ncbi:uncharacterized protein LOC125225473 [Leguminivora glycinivorella]|uniref:uncharacterized protein LOC125225473 n=1 Tax=Leguminivora glycinivorella TaxID=1035111 RepID=UPI00200C09A8|nr:uncharacterized protein LOC125225473 [Leguminivora glycinivorella]